MWLVAALVALLGLSAQGMSSEAPFDEDIALDPTLYVQKMKKVPFGRVVTTDAAKHAQSAKNGPLLAIRRQRDGSAGLGEGHRFSQASVDAESETEGRPHPLEALKDHKRKIAERRQARKDQATTKPPATIRRLIGAAESRLKVAMGGGGLVKPSMTDIEFCQGCQLALSQVIEHTNAGSSQEEIMFSLHSACHETVPVLEEVCEVLVDRDVLVAQELTAAVSDRDPTLVCQALGLCYPELFAAGGVNSPADASDAADLPGAGADAAAGLDLPEEMGGENGAGPM